MPPDSGSPEPNTVTTTNPTKESEVHAGQPTKYNEEVLASTRDYLAACKVAKMIPYIEELAAQLDVNEDTVYEWIKVHPEFSETIKKIKSYQKLRLMQEGLGNRANPSVTIFLLKANHQMIETEKKVLTGDENGGAPIEVIFKSKNDL